MSGSTGTPVPGTAVPIPSFTANGFVVPSQQSILAGLNSDWNAALGGNLNPASNTPQGQIIASQAALLGAMNDQLVALFNGVDPAIATGLMQDAIGYIYFIQRLPAQPTALQLTCTGRAGAVIPVNSFVQDTTGNIYFSLQQFTIPSGGSIVQPFAAQVAGPIPVPNTVTIFSGGIAGWDTAVVTSGVVGNNIESQTQFELRRSLSVSGNAQSTLSTIYANVAAVPDVLELYVIDNPLGETQVIGGVTLPANCLYVCTAGGAPGAVALAIFEKKPVGIPYFPGSAGNIPVQDPNPVYDGNGPIYQVSYEFAVPAPLCFQVTIYNPSSNSAVPSNASDLVAQAVQNAFQGLIPGSPAATIGSIIFANQPYITAINNLGPWAQVVSIYVGVGILGVINESAPNIATFTGSIAGTTLTVSGGVIGTIAIGMFIFGGTGLSGVVLPGTLITGGSGSSWTVNLTQTVTSTPLTTVTANLTAVSMQINWTPTLQNANVITNLTSTP